MRDRQLDGIKGILIFLVVLGHFLELREGGEKSGAYLIIYSFHMPAFVFVSGYFARWNRGKILKKYLPIYAFFQLSYVLFDFFIIGEKELSLGAFLTPYWHLWYLFSLMLYSMLLPFLSKIKGRGCHLTFAISVLLSLLFPMIRFDFYFLSLGRFFAFLPFFVLGNFCGSGKMNMPSLAFTVPFSLIFILCGKMVNAKMLYGSFAYKSPMEMLLRALLIFFALGWISMLLNVRKFSDLFCLLGENTLPIYLLHGFIQRTMLVHGTKLSENITLFLVSIATCLSLCTINFNIKNPLKAVDNAPKKVYNYLYNLKGDLIWISKKRLKK